MVDIKNMSAAELRAALTEREWREYLGARIAKEKERIALIQAKIDQRLVVVADSKRQLAELEAELASGKVREIPKPKAGGVTIEVPAGNLNVKGN